MPSERLDVAYMLWTKATDVNEEGLASSCRAVPAGMHVFHSRHNLLMPESFEGSLCVHFLNFHGGSLRGREGGFLCLLCRG